MFRQKEHILKNYDFNQNSWFLVKGYNNDTIQYLIDDPKILNKIKQKWVLNKSDRNFATTGGYNIELYNDSGRVMFMDIINDGRISMNSSGILYNSDYETLHYSNLNWMNIYKEKWIKAKLITKQFNDSVSENKFIDSLKVNNKVHILYHSEESSGYYIRCLISKNGS